jgi:hypothetical protein
VCFSSGRSPRLCSKAIFVTLGVTRLILDELRPDPLSDPGRPAKTPAAYSSCRSRQGPLPGR